jgi:hypothetical protein
MYTLGVGCGIQTRLQAHIAIHFASSDKLHSQK